MKYLYRVTKLLTIIFIILPFYTTSCSSEDIGEVTSITNTDVNGSTAVDTNVLTDVVDTLPQNQLSKAESDGLVFIREEEKLAHDLYANLFTKWGIGIFDDISNSEQTHSDAILILLDMYSITDPVGDNAESVFVDISLQSLYDSLVALGSTSLIDALLVSAAVEEIDLIDIQNLVDALEGNEDIALVYENLMKGSRNHLRTFVLNLERRQGTIYQPQYLSQDAYDAIINAGFETN